MNLKNQYKRLFEGRAAFAKANNLKISDSLLKEDAKPDYLDMDKDGDTEEPMKSALKENPNETFDYQYFIEQTEALIDTLEEYEQEIGTSLEMTADNTGDSYWKQTENQTSRYIMGAHKQLTGLLKKLQTGSTRVAKGVYKIN